MKGVTIATSVRDFDRLAADRVVRQIKDKPDSVIGLSTGRTTNAMHRQVAERFVREGFDVGRVTFFGLDEVTNVSPSYSGACCTMLRTEIIDALGIDDNRFLMLPTKSNDWPAACRLFEQEIELRGGIDLLMLGLGENGHLGFNQPGTPFEQGTWLSRMDAELEARIRQETQTPPGVPLGGVTLGLRNIMQARRIVLVAKGERKARIVRQMLLGPVTTSITASVLQRHPCCEFLLDTDAAKYLSGREI